MEKKLTEIDAFLRSAYPPDENQYRKFVRFIKDRYPGDVFLKWVKDDSLENGFRLEVGPDVYDWSPEKQVQQLEEEILHIGADGSGDVIPLLRDTLTHWTPKVMAEETGTVLTVGDGIATVSGLASVTYGEILLFSSGIRGMVLDLKKDYIGCILFGDDQEIEEGSIVKRTGKRQAYLSETDL